MSRSDPEQNGNFQLTSRLCLVLFFCFFFSKLFSPSVTVVNVMVNAVIKDQKWITRPLHAVSPRPPCTTGGCAADNNPLAAK